MSGAGARIHASEGPQRCSVAAISHASRGGLEKYPNASSRDHDQYWDSSMNRSTLDRRNPTRRTIVSTTTTSAATRKVWFGDAVEVGGEIIDECLPMRSAPM